jgi:very-short-patch-repair endonuclease
MSEVASSVPFDDGVLKRKCRYCDLREDLKHVCRDCRRRSHKKEWAVVQHLRRHIDTPFRHDALIPVDGERCSKRRPDIYFSLPMHAVIVEVDEHQHREYLDACECARLNGLVADVGGRSVVVVRYNPDAVRNRGAAMHFPAAERLGELVRVVKEELVAVYETFHVTVIHLFFDDDAEEYRPYKREDVTRQVCA